MYRVLTTNLGAHFSMIPPIKLSRLVDRKLKQMTSFQKSKYNRFSQIFMNLYIIEKRQSKSLKSHSREMRNLCLTSAKPMEKIVEYFQKTSKTYDEKYIVEVFENLVKASRVSQQDTNFSFDRGTNSKIFYTPAFDHLIQEFKFGLKKNVFISWKGMNRILDSLVEIGYIDEQIIQLVIQKISERLGVLPDDYESFDNEKLRLFQGQKRRYYDKGYNQVYLDVLNHEKFNMAFDHISERALRNLVKERETRELDQKVSQQQHKSMIKKLLTTIDNLNKNVESLTEAIIAIREQYRRMCKVSSMPQVLGNVVLNESMLEIEEELLEAGFIDIDDIKAMKLAAVEHIKTDQLSFGSFNEQKKKVQDILIRYLNKDDLVPAVTAYLQNQARDYASTQIQKQTTTIADDRYLADLSRALLSLSKMANSPYFLKKTRDGVSLISLQLQKNLLRGIDTNSQFLPVQRIFRKAYARIYSFLKENFEVTEFMMAQTGIFNRIQWIEALFRAGLYQQGANALSPSLEAEKGALSRTLQQINHLDNRQLVSFLNVINFTGNQEQRQLHHALISQLQERFSQQNIRSSNLSTESLCVIINYLYMNSKTTGKQNNFYERLLDELEMKVIDLKFHKNSTASHEQLDVLVNAFRILSFERGQKFGHKYFESFFDGTPQVEKSRYLYDNPFASNRQYSGSTRYDLATLFNPYKQPILQSIYKYTGHDKENSTIIITGFKGSKSSETMIGVYITDSTETSLDGKHIDGNLRAYFQRIKEFLKLELQHVSINSFLNINYDSLYFGNQAQIVTLKSSKQMGQGLQQIYAGRNKDRRAINSLIKLISKASQDLITEGYLNQINVHKITKILGVLKSIIQTMNTQTTIHAHYLAQKAKISVLLETVKRQIAPQNDTTWKLIDQKFQLETNFSLSQTLEEAIKSFKSNLEKLSVGSQKDNESVQFEGKRQSIQTVNNKNIEVDIQKNAPFEVLDVTSWMDKSFTNYSDWAKMLYNKTHHRQILIDEASLEVRVLARAFCPELRETLSITPTFKSQEDPNPIPYLNVPFPYDWQTIYTKKVTPQQMGSLASINNFAQQSLKAGSHHYLSRKEAQTLKLLSFIHELKTNKTLDEIYDYIAGFQFIGQVLAKEQVARAKHPEDIKQSKKETIQLLPRDPKAYFQYLQTRSQKIYLESPYMEYILEKIAVTESVKELLEKRRGARFRGQALYQQRVISRKGYKQQVRKAEEELIKGMEIIKNKVLDQSEDMISDASLKMVELEKNFEEFQRLFQRANSYTRELDEDFIQADGDYEKALIRKRARAEQNLIKFSIVHKLVNSKQLSFQEKEYLAFWQEQALNPKGYEMSFSSQPLRNVSPNDRERLKLLHNSINSMEKFALNDFVMELNNFIDESVLSQIQRGLFISNSKDRNIPEDFFDFSSNKQFTSISAQQERLIFEEKAKLSSADIDRVIEMVSISKIENPFLRKKYEQVSQKMRQDIGIMNEKPQCRTDLISLYCQRVDKQFNAEHDVLLSQKMKEKETERMWRGVFNKQYSSVSAEEIVKKTNKICQRMYLLRKNVPPFFSQLVLRILKHPNADTVTKQNLLANLQMFKIPLILDTEDLVGIAKDSRQRNPQTTREKEMQRLHEVSGKNFVKSIVKRISMIGD